MALVIGLIATLAMLVQHAGVWLAAGWSAVHGAGATVLTAFLPLALGLTVLWAGYVFLSRRKNRWTAGLFTIYALGILLLNEALLPATPLKL